MSDIDYKLIRYYYGVGYYDGRAHGSYSNITKVPDEFFEYYEEGYWQGVTDYSEQDAPKMIGG